MNNIDLTPDTGAQENTAPHPDDPHKTGGGSAQSPGGADASTQRRTELTHEQDGYPGPRPIGEASVADQTPIAGDTDPAGTASSEETGQAGALSATSRDPQKNKANAWDG